MLPSQCVVQIKEKTGPGLKRKSKRNNKTIEKIEVSERQQLLQNKINLQKHHYKLIKTVKLRSLYNFYVATQVSINHNANFVYVSITDVIVLQDWDMKQIITIRVPFQA